MKDPEKTHTLGSRLGAELDRLIAERPDLGWTEVAAEFTAKTGREITPATVARRHRRKSDASSRFLTDGNSTSSRRRVDSKYICVGERREPASRKRGESLDLEAGTQGWN